MVLLCISYLCTVQRGLSPKLLKVSGVIAFPGIKPYLMQASELCVLGCLLNIPEYICRCRVIKTYDSPKDSDPRNWFLGTWPPEASSTWIYIYIYTCSKCVKPSKICLICFYLNATSTNQQIKWWDVHASPNETPDGTEE